jgi:site-specific recombinase XerD
MHHRKRIQPIETGFVFCRLNGVPIKRFDSAWRHICEIAKINDFHYHDLRHTFCFNLLLSGANIKDVKEMIGHSNISMTDRYSHLTLNHHKAVQEKLATHYENLAN